MPVYTQYYELYKPNRTDAEQVDVTLSDNFDKIDQEIKNREDELFGHKIAAVAHNSNSILHGEGTVESAFGEMNTRIIEVETNITDKANEAKAIAMETQSQFDKLVKEAGDSNPEIVQARGGSVTLNSRLDDIAISVKNFGAVGDGVTNDQAALVKAVNSAYTLGFRLYWPEGTFISTDNIPNFHDVKHRGTGKIKRGTDIFAISPIGTQRNKLYVAATGGSNTFDGLSAGQPVARLQKAFDYMANYGPILTGYWEAVLTAGTFGNRSVLLAGLLSENPIEVSGVDVGGHPNVPTTIISEGVGAAAVGIFASNGSRIKVNNIKFTGFNGSTSSAGIKVANASEVTTNNCHFDSCYWGVSGEGRSKTVVPDGIFNSCGYLNAGGGTGAGIRSLQLNNHQIGIQNIGNNTNTAVFQNCYQAILAQESSTGHVDWCTIQDCVSGIVVRVNARVNADGTSFKRNTADFRVDANGHVYITSNTQFGTGADESTNKVVTSGGGNITNNTIIDKVEMAYGTIEKAISQVFVNKTYNTVSNSVFHSLLLKAPFWRGTPTTITPMKKLYFRIFGTINGTTSNKRINVRLGSALVGVTYPASENGIFQVDGYIYFTGADTQYLFLSSERHLGASTRKSAARGANLMTADVTLSLEAQVDNTADSIAIDMIEVGMAG